MKIFVTSDTHGRTAKAEDVLDRLTGVDLILHLGDYEKDALRLQQHSQIDVVSVKGNMDGSFSPDDYKVVETEAGRLLLTHGHMFNVKLSPLSLIYKALEAGCKAALFGHTHVPVYQEANGVYLINPGSLSQPRDGSEGSCAVIHASAEEFHCAIIYYSSLFPGKKAPRTGRLRQMLNDSDRF